MENEDFQNKFSGKFIVLDGTRKKVILLPVGEEERAELYIKHLC